MPGEVEYGVAVLASPAGMTVEVRAKRARVWGWRDWGVLFLTVLICVGAVWLGWYLGAHWLAKGGVTGGWLAWLTRVGLMMFMVISAWGFVLVAMQDLFDGRVTVRVNAVRVETEERFGLRKECGRCECEEVRRVMVALPRSMSRWLMDEPLEKRPVRVSLELKCGGWLDIGTKHSRAVGMELAQALARVIGDAQGSGGRALKVVDLSDVKAVEAEDVERMVATGRHAGGWQMRETAEGVEIFKPPVKGIWAQVFRLAIFRTFLWLILLPGPLMGVIVWLVPEVPDRIWRVFPVIAGFYAGVGVLMIFVFLQLLYSRHTFVVSQSELIDRYHGVGVWWTRRWERARVAAVSAEQKVLDKGVVSSRVVMVLTDGKAVKLCGGEVMDVVRLAGLLREAMGMGGKGIKE